MKNMKFLALLVGVILFSSSAVFAHHGPGHRHPGGHGFHGPHGHRPPMMHHRPIPHHHPHVIRTYSYYSPYYGGYYPYYGGVNVHFNRHFPVHTFGGFGAGFHISI